MDNDRIKPVSPQHDLDIHDQEYLDWISELSLRYRKSQIKASLRVNDEMLRFYWSIGKDITECHYDNRYGTHFYEKLSRDLSSKLNVAKGFSPTNLKYTKYFYNLYAPLIENRPQLVDDKMGENRPQLVDNFGVPILEKRDIFSAIFSLPWGHHRFIIDKCSNNPQKAIFFVLKSLENQWGRSMLGNYLTTDLYERQGALMTNFKDTLPEPDSEIAQNYFKDPYHLEFLELKEKFTEKELKNELMNKITQFLMELGKGFSFVGREYRLTAGGKDKYIDLLFYIIPLHRYCVIEVKITEFDFQDIGQLAGYTAMVDDLMNTSKEEAAIGLLICREKNSVIAHYALSRINAPIGISKYLIDTQQMPKEFQGKLPSVEEIERGINETEKKHH